MKLLLDTHALLWWLFDAPELSAAARVAIAAPEHRVLVSAATAWETATLVRLSRLDTALPLLENDDGWIARAGFAELPIAAHHAVLAGSFTAAHRDPFDRVLAAQAQLEDALLVSRDVAMDGLGAQRLW